MPTYISRRLRDCPKAAVPEFPPSLIQKAHDKALHEVEVHRELANRACGRVKSMFPKWNCTSVAVGDSPGWGVVKKATEWNADLVVGAQSHSVLERLFLGSVSHKVAAESPVRFGLAGITMRQMSCESW